MSLKKSVIFYEALALPPIQRIELIEQLLESFSDKRQKEIMARWAKEAEGLRIENSPLGKRFLPNTRLIPDSSIDIVVAVDIDIELKQGKERRGR